MVTVQDVKERWEQIQGDEERILFIVGGPGSGKSLLIRELAEQKGWKYLEAKQLIEEEFLLVPRDERPKLAEDVIRRALTRSDTEVVLLDGINVLFAPILNLEPLDILKTISKTYPIVVGWRGHLEGDQLYLEHNNNPKHAVVTISQPEHVIVID
ncbi:BREX-3 system P-loop-containing protein BrxF [Veillonella caviae]|uniref:BREX-3 system P-loop-containing protein BrxF n=1 Tax=Veillonella caviae TaxID=248316 RepID=UPI000F8DEF5C|nr:BREX-3 system P-loop-containing protein BrxF [Veillonella caviae]MCF0158596.1 BREX-3 system P-loop-containing protein BrxF [Veillonella sp.]MCI5709519.1 BREX-3 system P-loop-containing protein BrxF [Veillonella caviae]MCI6407818.1 BREX-3 system P-loop-containing protein BrxF [Veillonella caviae]MCI7693867.1 BREX-3 system P-loop-containing protein BrxF [Veillonella caviae]MDD7291363.1 BREX-3 system P-loop-containing protein BrxF [Veillonella caviae]